MSKDLTVIYLTANLLKPAFVEYQRQTLLKAIEDYPLISVSREPIDFGINLIDQEPKSPSNIYFQMLRAAKAANTPFVAIAEDDVLYPKDHFNFYRPQRDTFAYNQNRFALFTWGNPIFSFRNRKSNASLIAPRELLIEALEERFAKWPKGTPPLLSGEVGRPGLEKALGISVRNAIEVFGDYSLIQFNHRNGTDHSQNHRTKALGAIKCFDLYYWGKATEVRKLWK